MVFRQEMQAWPSCIYYVDDHISAMVLKSLVEKHWKLYWPLQLCFFCLYVFSLKLIESLINLKLFEWLCINVHGKNTNLHHMFRRKAFNLVRNVRKHMYCTVCGEQTEVGQKPSCTGFGFETFKTIFPLFRCCCCWCF